MPRFFLNWPSDSEEEDYFYIFFSIILPFHYYLPLEKDVALHLIKCESPPPKKKILKNFQYYLQIRYYLPLEKSVALRLNKLV